LKNKENEGDNEINEADLDDQKEGGRINKK
jgi:hypothetical protein